MMVNSQFSEANPDSTVKVIFFDGINDGNTTTVKFVVLAKTGQNKSYIAYIANYHSDDVKNFTITDYHYSSDIEFIKYALKEKTISDEGDVACDNLKKSYFSYSPSTSFFASRLSNQNQVEEYLSRDRIPAQNITNEIIASLNLTAPATR